VAAVKKRGFTGGSGSTGAVGAAAAGASGAAAGAAGTAAAWENAADAVSKRIKAAAGTAILIFKEFLLG